MNKNVKTFSADDIQSLSKLEWFKHRMAKDLKIDPLYVILGHINSYYGPIGNEPGTAIEHFNADDIEKIEFFEKLCRYFLSALGLKNDVVKERENDLYWIKSKQISDILKKQFAVKEAFLNRNYFQFAPGHPLFEEPKEAYIQSKQCSFLIGAGIGRNRSGTKLLFWIGYKAELVIRFLKNVQGFGDESISVQYNFDKNTEVHLTPESLLWNLIDDFMQKVELDSNKAL